MSIFLMLLVLAAVGVFVGYPLFKQKEATWTGDEEASDGISTRRDSIYSAIKELEFDYQLGNLSPEDHRELEDKYKNKAASLLMQLDNVQKGRAAAHPKDSIEREIMALRRSRKTGDSAEEALEREILARRKAVQTTRTVPCPNCSAEVVATARFCPQCGSSLTLKCPACGATYEKGDRFCSQCGAKFEGRKE